MRQQRYHVRASGAINSSPQKIVNELLGLKLFMKQKLEKCKVTTPLQ